MIGILDAIAGARHSDPFSVLGPHIERGRLMIRACLPAAEAVSVVLDGTPPGGDDKKPSGGRVRSDSSRHAQRRRGHRLPPARHLSGRLRRGGRRPVSLRPRHHRLRPLPLRRGQAHPHPRQARRPPDDDRRRPTASTSPSGRPTPRASASSATSTTGTGAVHPMRLARRRAASGRSSSRASASGSATSSRCARRHGEVLLKADPFGFALRAAAADRRRSSAAPALRVGRRRVDAIARADAGSWFDRPMAIYEVHLGSWARVPRRTANRYLTYRELAERLIPYVKEMGYTHIELLPVMEHPYSAIVGLSGHGLLRADQPFRHAVGLQGVRRRLPPARHRRHPRLGAGPLSEGRARPRAVRRHGALRARGSAAGRASRLGHADLQLRPQRGPELPARQRALLAAGVPRRRPARGRRRLDAVSRLLAQRRASGSRTGSAGARTSRRSISSASSTR